MGPKTNQNGNQKVFETSESGNAAHEKLWDSAKAVLKRKFIVIKVYIKRDKIRSQVNNLILHFEEIGKEKQMKPKLAGGRK